MGERAVMSQKQANTSDAGWSLITEGVTSARLDAHRLRKLLTQVENLIQHSNQREHLYQVAGDLIQAIPARLSHLERALDRTTYALAKIGEDHLKDRLPLSDRAMVEDGFANANAFPGGKTRYSAARVAQKFLARGDE